MEGVGNSSRNISCQWENVSIGGGGFVSGIYFHPKQPDLIYFVTNVGGLFQWDSVNRKSIPLMDSLPLHMGRFFAVNGLALHPTDINIIYIAAGDYSNKEARTGAIFKSSDKGKTWSQVTPPDWPVKVGGMDYPWVTQRLVIDPNNPDIILYGSNVNGLWRSANGGNDWNKVTTINGISKYRKAPFANETIVGIMTLAFDPKVRGRVYAGAFNEGIYYSDDSGLNWTLIPESPSKVFRMDVSNDGSLWVTHKPGRGNKAKKSGVSRYISGKWESFNPSGKKAGYSALAVNPTNPSEIITSTWWIKGPFSYEKLYRTTDLGKNWSLADCKVNHSQAWLPDEELFITISSLAFDPLLPGKVWLTGGYSVYCTEDIRVPTVTWTPLNKNLENTWIFDLAELRNGKLLSAVADISGFLHDKGLKDYPTKRFIDSDRNLKNALYTYSLAYTQSITEQGHPQKIVRTASQFKGFQSALMASTDGGITWESIRKSFSIPFIGKGYPFQAAIAPSDKNNIVVTRAGANAIYTLNGGKSWRRVRGLPKGILNVGAPFTMHAYPLAADGEVNGTYYYYDNGNVYKSENGGKSFTIVCSELPVEQKTAFYSLKTVPGKANEVYLNLESSGLYYSADGGRNWAPKTAVKRARLFATGKNKDDLSYPALYIYGTIGDIKDGIFRSIDGGENWENIQNPERLIGCNPTVMTASQKTFGQIFIGTAGRGIFYGISH